MRRHTLRVNGKTFVLDVDDLARDRFRVLHEGNTYDVERLSEGEGEAAGLVVRPAAAPPPASSPALGEGEDLFVRAPMPGLVLSVEVAPGARVERGDVLVKLEAMKMTNPIRARRDGVIAELLAAEGQNVSFGDPLLRLEA